MNDFGENPISIESESPNEQTITSKSHRIKTLDQLIEACEINLKEWVLESHVINKWDGQMKGGQPIPLWQVKAWLSRKAPEAVHPVISPVSVQINTPPSRKKNLKFKSDPIILHLADAHMGYRADNSTGYLEPFHDRHALDIALQVAIDLQPDVIVWSGDQLDANEWSDKFVREPAFHMTTQPAICELTWWLGQFKMAVPHARHIMLEGNHELRFPLAYMRHLPAAFKLKPATKIKTTFEWGLDSFIEVDKLGIEWFNGYPNNMAKITKHIDAIHGNVARKVPGSSGWALLSQSFVSKIFGHIHRSEVVTTTVNDSESQRVIMAASPGCLCRTDFVVPGHSINQNWQQGFGVAHVQDESLVAYDTVQIRDDKAYYNGQVYTSQGGFISKLNNDTEWHFAPKP